MLVQGAYEPGVALGAADGALRWDGQAAAGFLEDDVGEDAGGVVVGQQVGGAADVGGDGAGGAGEQQRDLLQVRGRQAGVGVLAAIVFVATSGCTWQRLPSASFGPSGATAHRRFSEWSKARVWAKLHRLVLDELGARGELDWSRCAIDSVNMRALKRGT
ncbi:Putative transposase of IS4/5 family [Streptomyces sp. MnatMP-M27]|nr:Putative transposase of IS4/5 family [Streptomyces sp. MnatMP-M27]